jgi:hypothetical protein
LNLTNVADVIETPQNDEITISESEIDTILTDVLNNIPTEPIFPETEKEIEIEKETIDLGKLRDYFLINWEQTKYPNKSKK